MPIMLGVYLLFVRSVDFFAVMTALSGLAGGRLLQLDASLGLQELQMAT